MDTLNVRIKLAIVICLVGFALGVFGQNRIEQGNPRVVVDSGEYSFQQVAFSEDGRELITFGDGAIVLWKFSVDAFAFSPDNKLLVGASSSGEIDLWDFDTGKLLQTFGLLPKYEHSPNLFLSFSPNGNLLAAKGSTGTIKVWDITSGKEIRKIKSSYMGSIAFSPDGKSIASSNESGYVQLWELATGKKLKPLEGSQFADSLIFSPDGRKLVNQIGENRRIWDLETGKESIYKKADNWVRLSSEMLGWFVMPINGKMIDISRKGSGINLTDVNSQKLLATIVFVKESDWVVTTPDGRFDASKGAFGSIHFTNGKQILDFETYKKKLFTPGLLQEVIGGSEAIR